jgi:hypothetical protein
MLLSSIVSLGVKKTKKNTWKKIGPKDEKRSLRLTQEHCDSALGNPLRSALLGRT